MNIGIDHGYYAIKTRHFSFPAGIAVYSHEPYTLQNTLEYGGKFFVCGTGRQPILRNKMENDNYYLLTLAAIAKEIKQRGEKAECSVNIAAGLPLAGFGREKKPFREYLLRSSQPVCFKFEGIPYKITIEDVKLFPQGYSATLIHCIAGEKEEVSPIVIENKIKELETEFDRLLVLAVDENDIIDHKLKQISETILKLKQQKKRIEYTAERSEIMESKAKEVMELISAEDLDLTEYSDALVYRIIERITVLSKEEIRIRFIGGFEITQPLR